MCICGSDKGFEYLGSYGNPYEGGSNFSRCKSCGRVRMRSEDGTMWMVKDGGFESGFNSKREALAKTKKDNWDWIAPKKTIADDMRAQGLNPENSKDVDAFWG